MAQKRTKPSPPLATLTLELLSQGKPGEPFVPPSEFRIFSAGKNESHKGTFNFTTASANRVMVGAQKQKNDYSIDYDHGMFSLFSADKSETSKAAGWFKPQLRGQDLWATEVSWTPKATEKLSQREFRYISPAFDHDEKGEIHLLRNVALTNTPAMFDLEPLLASWAAPDNREEEPPMKTLLALLGLADTASEAEAMAKLSQIQGPFTELLSLTSKASASDAMGVVKAWKVAADGVPAMHTELSQLKKSSEDAERQALIDEGKRRGVVPPAYEPVLKTMELSQMKEFLKVAVPVHPAKGKETNDVTVIQTVTLSQADKDVARQLGVSEEAFAKSKAARAGIVPSKETSKEA